jgi:hypothetical protein
MWEWLIPVITSIIGGAVSSASKPDAPKAPPPPRTQLQPMGQNRQARQSRNPYADAAAAGGMQGGIGDPGMVRLEAARSLRQGA